MLECFKNHGEFEFFAEKRLIFGKSKKPSGSPSKKPSSKGLRNINAIWKEISGRKPLTPSPSTPANTDVNRHTRTSEKPKYLNKKSAEDAERRDALNGKLEARETKRMQEVHESLYTEYMNPAFMMHLRMKGLADKVIPVLNLIMEHPGDFDYKVVGGNKHITKLKPYKGRPSDISDDFLVIIEKGGRILEVCNKDAKWTPEKNVNKDFRNGGKALWKPNAEFNGKMGLYHKRWNSEYNRYLSYRDEDDLQDREDAFKNIEGWLKNIIVALNIDFPQRFVDKVNIRQLNFEQTDGRVRDILSIQSRQGKNYEDLVKPADASAGIPDKWLIWVLTDPNLPGLYQIYTYNYEHNPLVVDSMGHIMHQDTNGKWVPDARYSESVRRKYYRDNKKVREADPNLTAEDKARMDRLDIEEGFTAVTGTPSLSADKARKIAEFTAKRQKVDNALFSNSPEVPLKTLQDIAKQISTNQSSEYLKQFDGIKDPKRLQNGIKGVLNLDIPTLNETRNNLVATILNVTL